MKKTILLSVLFIFGVISAFAGPFGLSMGMSLEEIVAECTDEPKYIADDRYLIQPTKSHPLFENYIAWVSETNGLYYYKRHKPRNQNDWLRNRSKAGIFKTDFAA